MAEYSRRKEIKCMKETMTTQSNMTEVETSRLAKYVERLREQPQWRNQLLIKNGQATFVKNGKVHTCNKIEGYVKLPDMKCVEPIQQIEMSIGFAPKMRMILWKDKKAYFRGYRKANTDGCILFIHAISESYDLLIVDIKDDIPALIAIDDSEIENVNSITYPILEYLIKNSIEVSENVIEEEPYGKGDFDDEWE